MRRAKEDLAKTRPFFDAVSTHDLQTDPAPRTIWPSRRRRTFTHLDATTVLWWDRRTGHFFSRGRPSSRIVLPHSGRGYRGRAALPHRAQRAGDLAEIPRIAGYHRHPRHGGARQRHRTSRAFCTRRWSTAFAPRKIQRHFGQQPTCCASCLEKFRAPLRARSRRFPPASGRLCAAARRHSAGSVVDVPFSPARWTASAL